jgi:hypothetical protein
MLQLMYNAHICDHAMCLHFHYPLWDTFTINFQLVKPLMHHYRTINVQLCCDYYVTIYMYLIQIHMYYFISIYAIF